MGGDQDDETCADRVKEANAQKLLGEFESISFKPGETIDDFSIRISKLATDLKGLGETSVDDSRVVRKFLRVVPARYSQVAVAIEMFTDMKKLTIEELVARLRAAEDRFEPSVEQVTKEVTKLLLTGRSGQQEARRVPGQILHLVQAIRTRGGMSRRRSLGCTEAVKRVILGSNSRQWVRLDGRGDVASATSTVTLKKSARRRQCCAHDYTRNTAGVSESREGVPGRVWRWVMGS